MLIGVPTEIKADERRVSLTPAGAAAFRTHGHRVIVQSGAGVGSGFTDREYREAGALIVRAPGEGWAVVVGYEDNHDAVTWQVQQLIREVGTAWPLDTRVGIPGMPLWRELGEFPALPEAVLTFKANLLPHGTAAFCHKAIALEEALLIQAHAGSGIVIGHAVGDLPLARAQALLKALGDEAARTLKAGETFYEPTGILHRVSRNPSARTRTRVLAVLLHPRDTKDLTVPAGPAK